MGCTKSRHKQIPTVWPLSSDSRQEWIAWRNCFMTYVNDKSIPIYKQGDKFFEYIGSVGLEISKNFYFPTVSSEKDIYTLLFKFDVYFIFGGRKRHSDESIDDYIKALETVAEKTAKSNIEKVVKEKILQDLKQENIFEKFLKINPSFSKIINYESLALHELSFIWEECRKPVDNKENLTMLEARKRDSLEELHKKDCCPQCDECHQGMKCKAMGQQCAKCGKINHFTKCCFKNYIQDCIYCGSNHIEGKCPAYAKECSRCKKFHHFSWQCLCQMTLSCDFCGQSHISSRQHCPAGKHTCDNCQKVGHFSFKCQSRRSSRRK